MRKAIIIGDKGQDGRLLYQLLLRQGYELIGIDKDSIQTNKNLPLPDSLNICESRDIVSLVRLFQPDELYHLAAFHHSSEDQEIDPGELWNKSYLINTGSLANILESVRQYSPQTRVFYASSSHVFGDALCEPQDETTPINPITVYGITKTAGMMLCRLYRAKHSVFASTGILYNHESIYRQKNFISRKIIDGVVRIKRGQQEHLVIGNLSAVADWGYAPDYVMAMYKILTLATPDDFVIATGKKHTVREFVQLAFEEVDLDWRDFVHENKEILSRKTPALVGNSEKLRRSTGWSPTVNFRNMVKQLVIQAQQHTEEVMCERES